MGELTFVRRLETLWQRISKAKAAISFKEVSLLEDFLITVKFICNYMLGTTYTSITNVPEIDRKKSISELDKNQWLL